MKRTLTPAGQTAPAEFDYSVLDTDTAEKLRGITECVCELQQSYAWGMAYQVGRAHDLLCGGGSCLTVRQLDKKANGNRGDATFTAWCDFIGISRPTAYNLLNAYALICDASPEQQKNLQLAPAKLLYAAGKKDAPADLVQAVKDGDITTHKQYQELLKENQQLRAGSGERPQRRPGCRARPRCRPGRCQRFARAEPPAGRRLQPSWPAGRQS